MTNTIFVKEGDVYRFVTSTGPRDYTATAEPAQCVLLTDEGFVPVPG